MEVGVEDDKLTKLGFSIDGSSEVRSDRCPICSSRFDRKHLIHCASCSTRVNKRADGNLPSEKRSLF